MEAEKIMNQPILKALKRAACLTLGVLWLSGGLPHALHAQTGPDLPVIAGQYDINELKRLIDIARESGFTDQQIKDITVEDEDGNVINAWAFIQEYERKQQAEADRLAAERARIYLTPHDIIDELDQKQTKDIDALREKLLFVE